MDFSMSQRGGSFITGQFVYKFFGFFFLCECVVLGSGTSQLHFGALELSQSQDLEGDSSLHEEGNEHCLRPAETSCKETEDGM